MNTIRPIMPDVATVAGAVVAVLFCIPSLFVGGYGAALIFTGERVAIGIVEVLWSAGACLGAYELVRCQVNTANGARLGFLIAGTCSLVIAVVAAGVLNSLIFVFAVFPAVATIRCVTVPSTRHRVAFTVAFAVSFSLAIFFYVDRSLSDEILNLIR